MSRVWALRVRYFVLRPREVTRFGGLPCVFVGERSSPDFNPESSQVGEKSRAQGLIC